MSDAERIRQLLLERIAEVAAYLFPNGKCDRAGNHWHVGSIEGEAGNSFKICIRGPKAGLHGDFANSEKHSRNPFDLWMQAHNVDFKTALHEAADWLGEPLQSKATFPTLDKAITFMAQKLKKLVIRRDKYHKADGNTHSVVVRFDGKDGKEFRPFHPTADGWVIGDPPGEWPLFHLPELIAPDLNPLSEPIFIPEGEKKVFALEALGLRATTSAHGAESAHMTDWQPMAGQNAVILPDNDRAGQGYAKSVTAILLRLSPQAKAKLINLPGLLEEGDDVVDLDRDARREAIRRDQGRAA
jgi:hypothetical protein